MKRFISLTLVIFTMLTLFACNRQEPAPEETPDNTEEIIDVDVPMSEIETEPLETEPPVVYNTSFVSCGDNIIYYGNVRDAKAAAIPGGRTYNFMPAYTSIKDYVASFDIAYINQETLMCGEGYELSYYPMFNGPQDLAYDLVEVGFDVINIANNHMLDKGGDGLQKTIDFWKTMPVTLIGGYSNKAEYDNVPIIERNGIKIALLSYCEMTNGLTIAAKYDTYIPYLGEADFKAHVNSVKDKCDIIVASVHWGQENVYTPNDAQKTWAKQMADAGIDVILGHHPHVIQPIEWIKGENGNETLCAYSLGNFMAEMAAAGNMVGGFLSFDITKVEGESATVDNVLFEPTVFHFPSNFYNNHIYFMKDYSEDLAAVHGVRTYYKKPINFDMLKGIVRDTISEEFLPEHFKSES
ncbi:MAG: hypothetical protein E7660_01230 [Ruminococcaceae bacterium]|nr:hypothetical protein [Oscillospiraceae bacterium]